VIGIFKKIINNSSKYNYDKFSSYVLHLDPTLTNKQNFTNKEDVEKFILEKVYEISRVKLEESFHIAPHFWKYGFVSKFLDDNYLYDEKVSLGFCGDYFMGEDLQSAFKSSQRLYEEKLQ
jgi:predicted NAD/FAD-dependent oxidoreductase